MKTQCADVFSFLSTRWSFQLRYQPFASIYRSELISQNSARLPDTGDDQLLAEAQHLSGQLRAYLHQSAERLADQSSDWGLLRRRRRAAH
jgi:hypothetical protein